MRWRKVWTVASTEFNNAVRTRAFLVSLLLLPVIYGIAIAAQMYANRPDTTVRTFAVVDHTGELFASIAEQAKVYNENVAVKDGRQVAPRFEPIDATDEMKPAQQILVDLSQQTRAGRLFAFVEIPAEIVDADNSGPSADGHAKYGYYTNTPTDMSLPQWLGRAINTSIQGIRFKSAGLDQAKVARAMMPVESEMMGLVDRSTDAAATAGGGGSEAAADLAGKANKRLDFARTFGPPIALVATMFMVIISTTPQLMQSVLEEKMSKISEVLLGSLTPFELMLGKLLGNVGVALVLATLYVGTAYGVAVYFGYGDIASPSLVVTGIFFLVLGVMLFGSLFMAVGSACNDMKDAQSLMFPVMMMAIIPIYFASAVFTKPTSTLATIVTLIPPATPFLMPMRMALTPAPPPWQVILSVVLTSATTLACVWAAARIFRIGLLMTGKAPNFAQLAKWVFTR